MTTKISVIVPTVGRIQEVRRLLDSLTSQKFQNFEVIIVDQNKDNNLDSAIHEYKTKLNLIHVKDEGHGASQARNIGVKKAEGEILLWPDDDSWYPVNLLEVIQEFFTKHDNVDGLIGLLYDENNHPHARKCFQKIKPVKLMDAFIYGAEPVLCFTKQAFLRLAGFDEKLGVGAGTHWGAGEGTDLCVRALKNRFNLLLSPQFVVHHNKPKIIPGNTDQIKKAKSYAMGMGAVLKKNKLPFLFTIQYFLLYFRSLTWNVIRLKKGTLKFHFSRLIGVIKGFMSYKIIFFKNL